MPLKKKKKSKSSRLHQLQKSRAPLSAQRQVTPNRGNKRSLPKWVSLQLVADVDAIKSNDRADFKFQWRDSYQKAGLNRDKVRKRFYYYRDIKCFGVSEEWEDILVWARNLREEIMSECV